MKVAVWTTFLLLLAGCLAFDSSQSDTQEQSGSDDSTTSDTDLSSEESDKEQEGVADVERLFNHVADEQQTHTLPMEEDMDGRRRRSKKRKVWGSKKCPAEKVCRKIDCKVLPGPPRRVVPIPPGKSEEKKVKPPKRKKGKSSGSSTSSSTTSESDLDVEEEGKRLMCSPCLLSGIAAFGTKLPKNTQRVECARSHCHYRSMCGLYPQVMGLAYIGCGYNIVYDKVTSLPLLQWTFRRLKKTYGAAKGGVYVPDQVFVFPINSHDESTTAKTYSSASSYQSRTSVSASVSGGFNAGVVSASVSATLSTNSFCAMSKAKSGSLASLIVKKKLFRLKLEPGTYRIREQALQNLETWGPRQFISTYGTHFVNLAELGGKKRYLATMSREAAKKSSSKSLAFSMKASFRYMFARASASMSYSKSSKSKNSSSKSVRNVKLWCTGGENCKGSKNEWEHSLYTKPGLIGTGLTPVWKLLPKGDARKMIKQYTQAYIQDATILKSFFDRQLTNWHCQMKKVVFQDSKIGAKQCHHCKKIFRRAASKFCAVWNCNPGSIRVDELAPNKKDLELELAKMKASLKGRRKLKGALPFLTPVSFKSKTGDYILVREKGKIVPKLANAYEGKIQSVFAFGKIIPHQVAVIHHKHRRRGLYGRTRHSFALHSYNDYKITPNKGKGQPMVSVGAVIICAVRFDEDKMTMEPDCSERWYNNCTNRDVRFGKVPRGKIISSFRVAPLGIKPGHLLTLDKGELLVHLQTRVGPHSNAVCAKQWGGEAFPWAEFWSTDQQFKIMRVRESKGTNPHFKLISAYATSCGGLKAVKRNLNGKVGNWCG